MKPVILKSLAILPVIATIFAFNWRDGSNGDTKKNTPYSQDRSFPYEGRTFTSFVDESFKLAGKGSSSDFYTWFDSALKEKLNENWESWIADHKKALHALTGKELAEKQIETGAAVHKAIKKTITKFSLDRGFEFCNILNLCERQCFLQSVLIAGILQKTGMNAGVVMVYRNIEGQPSNNGHAVCVAKLADGRDIVVDASEPMPFPTHKGLFAYDKILGHYQYVEPQYAADATIAEYKLSESGKVIKPSELQTLDVPFLRSQFDYYRGERTIDGILAKDPTAKGLEGSAKFFEKSQTEDFRNPLTVYMLGRTFDKMGKPAEAQKQYQAAMQLYQEFGWVPNGLKEVLR